MAENDETLDQSTEDNGTSAGAPSVTPDFQALIRAAFDERFSGLQSMNDKAISRLEKQIRDLKTAALTDEQQEQITDAERERDEARTRQMAELLRYRKTYPKAVDLWLELMESEDTETQLKVVETLFAKPAPAQAPDPTPDDKPAEDKPVHAVDRNQPQGQRGASVASALSGEEMTDDAANALFKEYGESKGFLSKIRSRG